MEEKTSTLKRKLVAGVGTGLFQTVAFNWWDRGLYLHIREHRPFLDLRNFGQPMQGCGNAMWSKLVSYGMFYALLDDFRDRTQGLTGSRDLDNMAAGVALGTVTSMCLNPWSAVKYQAWGKDGRLMGTTAMKMWSNGGTKAFTRGLRSVWCRDTTFSISYAILQPRIREWTNDYYCSSCYQVLINSGTVGVATVASAPFNYIRNQRYAMDYRHPPRSWEMILKRLWVMTRKEEGWWRRFRYVQHRFCIGWGTMRVAVGMSVGQLVYDSMMSWQQDREW